MRTLIIGDVHNYIETAEDCISKIHHDKVVFVGDYFDSFGDGKSVAQKTAEWLAWSMLQPNRTHLWGNHDIPYCNPRFDCPGFTRSKRNYIMKARIPWEKMQFYTWIDDFLVSHAGVHPCQIPTTINTLDTFKAWIEKENKLAISYLKRKSHPKHWFFERPFSRGGDCVSGGLLWMDWNYDFSGTFFNQIVGHTSDLNTPIRKKEAYQSVNYCVDGMWSSCLLLDNGNAEVYSRMIKNDGSYVRVEI